ncbi:MAG: NADH dehydrogenase (quinone) subunit G [Acidobacteria bacterium]|nr:NADH dehydrogenase (quinone) subunit G [Acidobacteriota bacterium]
MPDTLKFDMLKFTVDGRELHARPGTLLIDACRASGIEVPSFCYYPGLSLQAACRMCLVEIEKTPKLQTACTVPVAEGMIVRTATQPVADARRSMLELLLANHPLDCPVCDKGGECELQDMVFRYGAGESRFTEEKHHVEEQQWSPVVFFDAPRCILCYRCVRVCDEGMGVGALGVINRGAGSEIAPNHGDHLECEECGMCIDICPVGALTSGAYRYKARPWEIQYVSTICTHCGDGCKTTLSVRNNKILRGNNRDHSGVNGEFLCIKGRYAYDFVEHADRLKRPLVRKSGTLTEVSWDEAIRTVAARWKQTVDRQLPPERVGVAVIGSNHTTNETNYLLQRFTRTVLRSNHIDHLRTADFPALMSALSATSGTSGQLPLASSRDLAQAKAILIVGNNPTDQHPLLAWNIREAVRLAGARLYVINSREIPLAKQSFRLIPVGAGCENTAIRYLTGDSTAATELIGRTAGGRNVSTDSLQEFRDKLLAEENVVIVFGSEVYGTSISQLVKLGEMLKGPARYIALADYSNSRGAADMGLYPHLLPGFQSVRNDVLRLQFEAAWGAAISPDPGMNYEQMLQAVGESRADSLYVVGANPWKTRNPNDLAGKSFLVVQDLFLHETAQAADVVLPAASAYECNGTVTNTCGELQRRRMAINLPGARPDIDIIADMARQLGADSLPASPDEILREILRVVPGYTVSYAAVISGMAQMLPGSASETPGPVENQSLVQIRSVQDHLFSSGTMGRYSSILNLVPERTTRKQPELL